MMKNHNLNEKNSLIVKERRSHLNEKWIMIPAFQQIRNYSMIKEVVAVVAVVVVVVAQVVASVTN